MSNSREDRILDTALRLIVKQGYSQVSMLQIAKEAHASKETIYKLFQDKEGLIAALVRRQSAQITDKLSLGELRLKQSARAALVEFGIDLLNVLLSANAIAINRLAASNAASDSAIGRILGQEGKERTAPLAKALLEHYRNAGEFTFTSFTEAFDTFIGLLVGDWHIRVVTGAMSPPSVKDRMSRVARAVDQFFFLYGAPNMRE